MADLFRDRYRIPSARRPKWNYASRADYFITICTHGRLCYFGDVLNGVMNLSEIGEIVKDEWIRTAALRSDMNLTTDIYVIMPNHFHAIVTIGENAFNTKAHAESNGNEPIDMDAVGRDAAGRDAIDRDAMHRVSTGQHCDHSGDAIDRDAAGRDAMHRVSTWAGTGGSNAFGPQTKNLVSIVRGFKSAVTGRARQIHAEFRWQSRFHDHIIRNEEDYAKIRGYILNNPRLWKEDSLNPDLRIGQKD